MAAGPRCSQYHAQIDQKMADMEEPTSAFVFDSALGVQLGNIRFVRWTQGLIHWNGLLRRDRTAPAGDQQLGMHSFHRHVPVQSLSLCGTNSRTSRRAIGCWSVRKTHEVCRLTACAATSPLAGIENKTKRPTPLRGYSIMHAGVQSCASGLGKDCLQRFV